MNIKTKFMTSILAGSVVSAMSLYPVIGYAADDASADDSDALEEIVVTGIRGSQMRAMETKRNANSIVDSIASEDIGKFPDSNISEALQRITGVTISRSGGEGQFVTVRGMGPAFNTVLYNGRVLATENDGREFSFDVLPAELIGSVDVYKTAPTNLIEGGIGATINMKTPRPLDKEGFHGSLSAKGLYDTNRKNAQPQFSGILSDTFMDGKFGILGSFSYNKRDFKNERVFTDGFEANQSIDFNNDGTPDFTGVSLPTFTSFDVDVSTRKRTTGSLTLQWQASDDLLITLDGLYSKLDVNASSRSLFFFGGPGDITQATVDANNTVTSYKGQTQERIVTFIRPRFAKTREAGFNAEWQANDNLSAVFDAAYSKSTDSTSGNQAWFDANLNISDPAQIVYNQTPAGTPSYSNIGNLSDSSQATNGWFTFEGRSIKDETYQTTFDVTYDFDDAGVLTSINAGASYAQREKIKTVGKTPSNVQNLFSGVPLPQSLFSTVSSKFLNGGVSNNSFPTYSVPELQAYLLSDAGINAKAPLRARDKAAGAAKDAGLDQAAQDAAGATAAADPAAVAAATADIKAAIAANGGTLGIQPVPGAGGGVKEKNYDAYIQANFAGSIGETPWSGNIGLRYTKTNIRSVGVGQNLIQILANGTDFSPVFSDPVAQSRTGSYRVWLPSANFKLTPFENIVFRASVAKTLTRATLSDLLINQDFNVRPRALTVASGNPGLKPMIAWNYDTNLTWYIDDASYLSVAYFHKDLSAKSERQTNIVQILGRDFQSNRPENIGNGSVDGVELTAQYTFSSLPAPFDGLGVQANYTTVVQKTDSRDQTPVVTVDPDTGAITVDIPRDEVPNQTSETFNGVVFYEKGPFQARAAYSYRAGFLEARFANRGQPRNIRAYGQWDASMSYDLPWYGLTIFAEAINIRKAQSLSFSTYQNRVIQLEDTGARYSAGVRVSF